MFNCPDWGITAQQIDVRTVSGVVDYVKPRLFSCKDYLRVCIPSKTDKEEFSIVFMLPPGAGWVHIAEISLWDDAKDCTREAIVRVVPAESGGNDSNATTTVMVASGRNLGVTLGISFAVVAVAATVFCVVGAIALRKCRHKLRAIFGAKFSFHTIELMEQEEEGEEEREEEGNGERRKKSLREERRVNIKEEEEEEGEHIYEEVMVKRHTVIFILSFLFVVDS